MRNRIIPLIATVFICLLSCTNKSGTTANHNEIDTLWNNHIQNVFFDVSFGANKEEVISKFAKHGFLPIKLISNDHIIHFNYTEGKFFTFGGMNWEMIRVGFINGKFYIIDFMNSSEDKASALKNFEDVRNVVAKKYLLTDIEHNDTTVYKTSVGFGKDNRRVGMSCFRYETVNKQIKIGVDLGYSDDSIDNGVNEEL